MKARSSPLRSIMIILAWIVGCGQTDDPRTDRQTIENFVNSPKNSSPLNADRAARRLAAIVAGGEESARDRLLLAAYYDAVGEPESALDQLNAIPDDMPDSRTAAAARLSEGRIRFYRTRQARSAELALASALRLDAELRQAWQELADLHDIRHRIADRDACLAKLDELAALDRNHLIIWTCRRPLDSEIKSRAEVLEAFLAADPADSDSAFALADLLAHQGEFERAKTVLEHLSSEPNPPLDSSIAIRRATVEILAGDFEAAARLVDSLSVKPDSGTDAFLFYRCIGHSHLQYKRYEEAAAVLRKALTFDSLDRETLQLLVQALRLGGQTEEIAPFARRLSAIDRLEDLGQKSRATLKRDDIAYYREIAETAASLGKFELARAWLRQILAKNPLDSEIQQEIYRIGKSAEPLSPPKPPQP